VKVKAGDKSLIPAIPKGKNADPIFQRFGQMTFFPGSEKAHRTINKAKCTYPKCSMCADECPVKAINLKADPPAFNYKTCLNCCLCDHMCPQLAIEIPDEEYYAMHTHKVIDMKKCKYPKCTICIDHCSMKAIDFSVNPPVFKRSCEGDDLCWVICPEGAIEITNMADTHGKMMAPGGPGNAPLGEAKAEGPGGQGGPGKAPPHPMVDLVAQREAQGRFRRHIPREEVGKEGRIMDIKRTPRFDIDILMEETPAPVHYKPKDKKKK
jgi:Fe-S-cluster-containing hydrogenase component 2